MTKKIGRNVCEEVRCEVRSYEWGESAFGYQISASAIRNEGWHELWDRVRIEINNKLHNLTGRWV